MHRYNYLSYTMEATCIHTSIEHVHHIHILSLCFPNIPGFSSDSIPHPCSQHSLKTNHCTHAINPLLQLNRENDSKQSTGASKHSSKHGSQHGENNSPKMYQRTILTNVGRQQHIPGNGSIKRLTQTTLGKKLQSPSL